MRRDLPDGVSAFVVVAHRGLYRDCIACSTTFSQKGVRAWQDGTLQRIVRDDCKNFLALVVDGIEGNLSSMHNVQ